MGKGLTIIRSLRRKHYPDMQDRRNNANHIAGNSTEGKSLVLSDYGSEYY